MGGRDVRTAAEPVRALTDWFYGWELRGRGWQSWSYAVDIEPPFRRLNSTPFDSGPFDSGPFDSGMGFSESAPAFDEPPGWREPWAEPAETGARLCRLPMAPPGAANEKPLPLAVLKTLNRALTYELTWFGGRIEAAAIVQTADIATLENALRANSRPDRATRDRFGDAWVGSCGVAELGLTHEFLIPLPAQSFLLARVVAAMARLPPDEVALLQVQIKPVQGPWAREMLRAALGPSDEGLFDDDLVAACRRKIAQPLFAVVARVAARTQAACREICAALCRPDGANALTLLPDGTLERETMRRDLAECSSHRSGMILNAAELAELIPIQATAGASRDDGAAAAAEDTPIGVEAGNPIRMPVRLALSDRLRHMRITGDWGAARTNLLVDMILRDLDERNGIALIDCDGAVCDLVLRRLPRHRLADVAFIDPSRVAVPLDLLRADTAMERSVLDSDLIAVLSRLDARWNAQTSVLFANTLAALRGQDGTPTLFDLRRALAGETASEWSVVLNAALDKLLDRSEARAVVCGLGRKLDIDALIGGGALLARLAPDAIGAERSHALASLRSPSSTRRSPRPHSSIHRSFST